MLSFRQPEIFRDAAVWRTEYEPYGSEVWEKNWEMSCQLVAALDKVVLPS